MAGVSDRELKRVGPWPAGINNIAKEDKLPADERGNVLALREADNLDFDDAGWPHNRYGQNRIFNGDLTHSLWSHDELPFGLFVDAGTLQVMRGPGEVASLGVTVGSMPVSYVLINDRIYFSNRTVSGLVTLDLDTFSWAPATPDGQPLLAAVDGFGLRAGKYQVAITFVDALGRESGSTESAVVDLEDGQGIHLTQIPQPPAGSEVPVIRIYVTPPNDGVPLRYAAVAAGTTETFITSDAAGRALTTQFLRDMPACQFLAQLNGRLIGASGRELIWSESLRYGSYHPVRNRLRFNDTIDLLVAVGHGTAGAGVFVAAGKRTYWLPAVVGEDQKLTFNMGGIVHSSGVVPGTGLMVPTELLGYAAGGEIAVWLARSGQFCEGAPGGAVTPLRPDQIAMNSADRGAVMLRQQDGINTFIAALRGPRRNGLAVTDRAVAHVIHADP